MEFEKEYFNDIYGGDYDKRNPNYKFKGMLKEILKFKREGNLLEIGCAYGNFSKIAATRSRFKLYGIDVSKYGVGIAKQRLKDKEVSLKVAELLATGFKDNSFDVVCMFDVLEHINDLGKAFCEAKRILTEEGLIVFTVPVYDGLAGKIVGRLDIDPTHVNKESRTFWLKTCNNNGLIVIRWLGIIRYFLGKRFYLHLQTKVLRKHTPAIMIIAKVEQHAE